MAFFNLNTALYFLGQYVCTEENNLKISLALYIRLEFSLVYPLKILLSSDKLNVLKTSSIEDRGHSISETIGISHIICCFHPLQTDKKIVFDNLV